MPERKEKVSNINDIKKNKKKSVIQIYGYNLSSCGYCGDKKDKKVENSISYGFVSDYLLVEDYETLMLAGWRRSGRNRIDYLYY